MDAEVQLEVTRIDQALDQFDTATKAQAYVDLLKRVDLKDCCSPTVSLQNVSAILRHLTEEIVALAVARAALTAFFREVPEILPDLNSRALVLEDAVQIVRARLVSFEDQMSVALEKLGDVHEARGHWLDAANTLAAIPFEAGMRVIDNVFKMTTFVRISRLYLQADEPANAETFIQRASALIGECTLSAECQLQY